MVLEKIFIKLIWKKKILLKIGQNVIPSFLKNGRKENTQIIINHTSIIKIT